MAIASAMSFNIANRLQWEYPFYAVIAAIIVMATTHGSTFKLGIQRLIGTIIGAIGGAAFAVLLGSNSWSLAASVFLTIFLASYWKFGEASKLAGYISAIVILTHNQSPWIYAWGRFLETLLGIGVAMTVSRFVFPTSVPTELRQCLAQTLVELEQFYRLVIDGAFAKDYDRSQADILKTTIASSFLKGEELWQEIKRVQADESPNAGLSGNWEFLIRRIWEHTLTMEHTILARQQSTLWQILTPQLTQLAEATSDIMLNLATSIKLHKPAPLLSKLDVALTNATEQLHHLHETQQQDLATDDLLRFFTFFYTMEEVGRKLQRITSIL